MGTLLIVPGWGGNKKTWQGFKKYLQEHELDSDIKTKILELPCFGDRPCPDEVWGVEEYAEFVNKKIKQEMESDTIYLLGHSFGGAVAARAAHNYPNTIDKLILTAPALKRPNKKFKKAIFYLISKIGKLLFKLPIIRRVDSKAKKVLYKFAGTHDYRKTSGMKSKIFKKIIKENEMDIISELDNETLIIWGEDDELLPVETSFEIVKELPNAWLRIIKKAGHGLHKNNKQQLRKSINKFIK
ncbi:MAG: alpha/beta fold hydrolase [Candidatus Paceibacteria bacterium]